MPTVYESLQHDNQFRFTCPIFNAETRMGACTELRDKVYMGQIVEKRLGCQAAMRCGKCPATEMVSRYCFDKTWKNDHHGSMTPKQGKLMKPLLEKVLRVSMRDNVMNEYHVSDKERELLLTANERIAQQLKTAPGESSKMGKVVDNRNVSRQYGAPVKEEANVAESAISKAAMTGDMSAALNA